MLELGLAGILVMALVGIGLGIILIAVRGTSDVHALVCARCRADVRAAAWRSNTACTCGAALDAPRAMRLPRRRRPRLAVLGVVILCGAAAIAATSWHLRARGLALVDIAPDGLLAWRFRAGDEWAATSLSSRWEHQSLG